MSARVIDVMAGPDTFLAALLLMDGLPAYTDGEIVWTDALCQHRPDEPTTVEIRGPWEVDMLVQRASRCLFLDCPGRETARRILGEHEQEIAAARREMVGLTG